MKGLIKKLLIEGLLDEEVISGKYYHGSSYPKIEWGLAPEDYHKALFGYGIYVTTSNEEAMAYAVDNSEFGYVFSMSLNNLNVVNFYDEPVSDEIRELLESEPNFYSLFEDRFDPNKFNFDDMEYSLGDNIYYDWDEYDDDSDKIPGYFLAKWVDGKLVDEIDGLSKEDVLNKLISLKDVGYFKELGDGDIDADIKKETLFNNYGNIYFYMAKKLNSFKESSKLFAKLGIDGFKTKGVGIDGVYLGQDDYIVNIINPSKLKNIKAKKVTKEQFKKIYDI